MKSSLEKFFKLSEHNTDINTELLAGFTTFVTMAYIIFVNPQIMSLTGMDQGAIFVGTCLAAAIACFIMGFYSNWPVGLAPGMGLNPFSHLQWLEKWVTPGKLHSEQFLLLEFYFLS